MPVFWTGMKTSVLGVWRAEVGKPAAVLQIVLHGVVVDAVQGAAVPQRGLLDAEDVNADDQIHLGFCVCRKLWLMGWCHLYSKPTSLGPQIQEFLSN